MLRLEILTFSILFNAVRNLIGNRLFCPNNIRALIKNTFLSIYLVCVWIEAMKSWFEKHLISSSLGYTYRDKRFLGIPYKYMIYFICRCCRDRGQPRFTDLEAVTYIHGNVCVWKCAFVCLWMIQRLFYTYNQRRFEPWGIRGICP